MCMQMLAQASLTWPMSPFVASGLGKVHQAIVDDMVVAFCPSCRYEDRVPELKKTFH